MENKKKSKWLVAIIIPVILILIPIIIVMVLLLGSIVSGDGEIVRTTDIGDYGIITGNYDNDTPARFMFSFFPEEISEDFSNVSYRYTAEKGDTYACEIWLEFDIEDEEKYHAFIRDYTTSKQFPYDTDYMDYTASNDFYLTGREYKDPDDLHIEYAQIGKVLYCDDTQHIIFYALCMLDGGYSSTKTFGDFFTRFNIDPVEYQSTANAQ